ncbi:hypothetical protein BH10CYA1_BH10CYA1_64280 [soil metagenome]
MTSTKQLVWAGSDRIEERDASGAVIKKFYDSGQMNNSIKYFYANDHLNSIREMIDISGVVQAQYSFDPYGRATKFSESVPADFGYAGYYMHSRSNLSLTQTRAFNSSQARFINRDLIEESGVRGMWSTFNARISGDVQTAILEHFYYFSYGFFRLIASSFHSPSLLLM